MGKVISDGKNAAVDRGMSSPKLLGIPYIVVELPHTRSLQFQLDLSDVGTPSTKTTFGALAAQLPGGSSRVRSGHEIDIMAIHQMLGDDDRSAQYLEQMLTRALRETESDLFREAGDKGILFDTAAPSSAWRDQGGPKEFQSYQQVPFEKAETTAFGDTVRKYTPVGKADRSPTSSDLEAARLLELEKRARAEREKRMEQERQRRELETLTKELAAQRQLESNELYGEWA